MTADRVAGVDRLNQIEQRREATTEGPWRALEADDGRFYGQPPTRAALYAAVCEHAAEHTRVNL